MEINSWNPLAICRKDAEFYRRVTKGKVKKNISSLQASRLSGAGIWGRLFLFFFEDSRISLVLKGLGSFLWIMFKGCMLQGRAFQRSINYFPSPNSYEVSFWNFVLQKIGEAFYFCPAVTVAWSLYTAKKARFLLLCLFPGWATAEITKTKKKIDLCFAA